MKKINQSLSALSGNGIPPPDAARQAKVNAIKQAVDAGTYRVDNRTLADSLLSDILWEQWEKIRFLKP
jgi:anti-sigma28 factor (negative regulator of flagellin synthesis)